MCTRIVARQRDECGTFEVDVRIYLLNSSFLVVEESDYGILCPILYVSFLVVVQLILLALSNLCTAQSWRS